MNKDVSRHTTSSASLVHRTSDIFFLILSEGKCFFFLIPLIILEKGLVCDALILSGIQVEKDLILPFRTCALYTFLFLSEFRSLQQFLKPQTAPHRSLAVIILQTRTIILGSAAIFFLLLGFRWKFCGPRNIKN